MNVPILQLIVDGIGMGLIYVILAAGLVLVMKVSGILLIAYGELFTTGAMSVWAAVPIPEASLSRCTGACGHRHNRLRTGKLSIDLSLYSASGE